MSTQQVARTRYRSEASSSTPTYEIAAGPVANWTQFRGYTPPIGTYEAMSDVVTVDFHKRKANGEVIFNPKNQTRITLSDNSKGATTRQVTPAWASGQTYSSTGNFLSGAIGGITQTPQTKIPESLIPPVVDDSWVKRAVSEACTQAWRPPSHAHVLVTLAELEKTRRLVPDLLKNWQRLFTTLNNHGGSRKFPVGSAGNAVRKLGKDLRASERSLVETWLAMRFGVRPLVIDTLGVLDAIKAAQQPLLERVTQRGHAAGATVESSAYEIATGVTRTMVQSSGEISVDVRAMNLWSVKMDLIRDIGVSLAAIPEAAIDLVRFSFVVNWMVNVNDFFASIGSGLDLGLRTLGGCYTTELSSTRVVQALSSRSTDPTYVIDKNAFGVMTVASVKKSRVVGLVSPKLVVRADPMKFTRDLRLLDAVALTRQVLRGRNTQRLAALSRSSTSKTPF